MATITGLTADRMLAIEAASVVDGDVVGDNLILTKHDGTQINAGSVRGPQGDQGPVGHDTAAITAVPVLDVGLSGQIRAGRQLSPADFGNLGLSAPLGLWNLSDLSDVSGNGRNLLNKGVVPFDVGINGGAATAAKFVGSTAQVLYIPDTGAADPFRIRTGSWGCWFKVAKRGLSQYIFSKFGSATTAAVLTWSFYISATNNLYTNCSSDGITTNAVLGISDVVDDHWHFAVVTHDGSMQRLYVDSILEGSIASPPIQSVAAPLNIGGFGGDGGAVSQMPFYGRVDEAFVTNDVLSEDQIRNLYCVKIAHTIAAVPSRVSVNVYRRRKGAALVAADFPAQPLRLHNFSAGSLGDEGSNGQALTDSSGVGGSAVVAGADGTNRNAYSLTAGSTNGLFATDTGLPAALTSRSYGCWFKTLIGAGVSGVMVAWGTAGTGHALVWVNSSAITCNNAGDQINGPLVSDGQWHHVVAVEDNGALDGVKRKVYLDGRIVAQSLVMNAIVLAGANRFRIGANVDGSASFTGQIDGAFVCGYALTSEQVQMLFIKSLLTLASSPKNAGDHIEAMDAAKLLVTFDTLEPQYTVDLLVAP